MSQVPGEVGVVGDVLAEGHEEGIDGAVESNGFGADDADGNIARRRKRKPGIAQRTVPAHRGVDLRGEG